MAPGSPSGEAALFDLSGWLLGTARIIDWVAGGVLVTEVPPDKQGSVPVGRPLRFQLTIPDGDVRGMAEVVEVDGARVSLRLTEIDHDGLPRLLSFLRAWAGG